ncbi:hypothetical protein [Xenophilus sp. Marseille-Q4582]|uniref:hypothetical protein n=1 Tax=Xenophilus sp. Marseille-Q4582 TaxID=2866600 RepID=UPI001CE3C496|nr:hypothetical protein [Xenophilus sp. Marseille-Q4582]
MRNFAISSDMLATLGGAFYPTGHAVLMFESPEQARRAADQLVDRGALQADAIQYIAPETLLSQIAPTVSDADNPLPSPGTDAATVRAFTALAREGHAALLVPTPDDAARDAVMAALEGLKPSMAQRYRALVIEDL